MPPLFRSTSSTMNNEARQLDAGWLWGLAPSLILHALIIALLVYGTSSLPLQPQDDGTVNVVMVPPPDQAEPKPVPAPPEPKAEKPVEQKAASPKPIEVLKPVSRFGAEDTGPRKSLAGDSGQESEAPAKAEDPKPPAAVTDGESQSAVEAATAAKDAGALEPDEQEPSTADAGIELPMAAATPRPRPTKAPKPARQSARRSGGADVEIASSSQGYSSLPGVRRLFSQGATGDPFATTSMDGVPRDQRVGKLCATALQQKLRDEGYSAELLPYRRLKAGNVLADADATFRTRTAWYRVSFKCEVDANATRVLSFASRTGAVVPQAEWAELDRSARF